MRQTRFVGVSSLIRDIKSEVQQIQWQGVDSLTQLEPLTHYISPQRCVQVFTVVVVSQAVSEAVLKMCRALTGVTLF